MLPTPPYVGDMTAARSILRAYEVDTLYRPTLPDTEAPALVLPRRPGFVSMNPERSFSQDLVRSLENRLPDEQRHILEDLAMLTTMTAARRAGVHLDETATEARGKRRRWDGCWRCCICNARRASDGAPYHVPITWPLHGA